MTRLNAFFREGDISYVSSYGVYVSQLLNLVIATKKEDSVHVYTLQYGPRREKTCLRGFANNTGADQPAHPRSLISAFVIRLMESIICKIAIGEISIFRLVSVDWFGTHFVGNPEDRFSHDEAQLLCWFGITFDCLLTYVMYHYRDTITSISNYHDEKKFLTIVMLWVGL